jgi:hypothetical protein
MRYSGNGTATVAMLALFAAVLTAGDSPAAAVLTSRGPQHHNAPSSLELVLEGGLVQPVGDLADDYFTTETGFDAGTGYQLGARVRQYVGPHFAVSPAFSWTDFGPNDGVNDFGSGMRAYSIETSVYRYGLDFQLFLGPPRDTAGLFLTGGVALMHNVYQDEIEGGGWYETSVDAPGLSAGIGLRMGLIELTGEYNWNRFSTNNLNAGGPDLDYNWDYAVIRMGLALGR